MRHVYNGIYIGNRDEAMNHELMKINKIQAILNLSSDGETPTHKDIATFKAGLNGSPDYVGLNAPHIAVELLDMLFERYNRILVHCGAGHNRSPMIVALWLTVKKGVLFAAAAHLVKLEMQPWMAEFIDLTNMKPTIDLRYEHIHPWEE